MCVCVSTLNSDCVILCTCIFQLRSKTYTLRTLRAFQCLTIRQQFTMYSLPACMSLTIFTVFLLVTFYRDSMLLATMALLTSIIIRGLKRTSVSAPVWISGLSNWALMNRFGQILIFHNLYPKVRVDFTFTYISYSAKCNTSYRGLIVLCVDSGIQ